MEQQWQMPQVFVRYWVDWGTHHSIRWWRIGRPFLHCNETRKKSERENYGNSHWTQKVYKDHWINAVTFKRRSRHAKDCTMSIQQSLEVETNLSLRSSKSTKARSTVWRPWRMRLSTWSFHRMAIRFFFHDAFVFIRHHDGNQAATYGQCGTGNRGNLHPGVNSEFFFNR